MEANPSVLARRRPARAEPARPRQSPRRDDLTVDPGDRRRRANAALLELVVERGARRAG
ncbi:hypothetical protein [Xylanimonas oleitrophica]|uniref:hypothetical protein n=1 Tax=Xylanimonas oleitrophica TaxID=2607479 RepID=UPI0015D0A1E9|nr:hypothetical protein [Xylanimonas oleitrophica]